MLDLGTKLTEANGRPSGFDYLRILLAVAVVCQHSMNTTMGMSRTYELLSGPLRAPVAIILPMFFALSGFLVTGSLLRSRSLIGFVGLRILRIAPALCVEACIVALLLGPALTSFDWRDYFADPAFYAYFLNIVGDIQYTLPGLFLDNPVPETVNSQLWTVPYELKCYLALALLAASGLTSLRVAYLGFLILVQLFLLSLMTDALTATVDGSVLVGCFLSGVGFYLWRERIPYHHGMAAACLIACAILLLVKRGDFLIAAPVTYLTCYLGLANPPRLRLLSSGDYSYGMFLYGYPIQQALSSFGPAFWHWWINIAICVPLSLLVAICSWHLVEKRALGLKAAVTAAENIILNRWKFVGFWRKPIARLSD
ncbi:acyltransferase [Bradyrhizobium tropiciagri]|uniref:acyltransferase family protein n=1 Tax=Bradyrhizobium tropiciagri TaxID=312253 RepID=UPI001BABD5A2|nr:acyltransferase [Bradyrhizobium tropiciagri]MBR0873047.1 acyltransferase [Bradyrhizobium tropiciagri]